MFIYKITLQNPNKKKIFHLCIIYIGETSSLFLNFITYLRGKISKFVGVMQHKNCSQVDIMRFLFFFGSEAETPLKILISLSVNSE